MATTSTTRRGTGKGHGGPAQGFAPKPAEPFTADSATKVNAADLNHDPASQEYRQQQLQRNRERREEAYRALDAMVKNESHPWHGNAVREALNRTEGLPVQKVETTGAEGGPMIHRIERVIIDPKNPDR